MSRICYGIALLCIAATCQAQYAGAPLPSGQGIGGEYRSKVVDPKAVQMPLYPGALVSEVLTALTDKGFQHPVEANPGDARDEVAGKTQVDPRRQSVE